MLKSRNEPGEGPCLKPTEVNLTTPSRESRSWEYPADAATGPKIVQLLDLVVVEGETGRRDSHYFNGGRAMGTHILARIGYEAYGDVAEWKNYEGKPMPGWNDLRPDIKEKWEAAAAAIEKAVNSEQRNQVQPR